MCPVVVTACVVARKPIDQTTKQRRHHLSESIVELSSAMPDERQELQ